MMGSVSGMMPNGGSRGTKYKVNALNTQIKMPKKKKYTVLAGFLNMSSIPINMGIKVSDMVSLLRFIG